MHMQKIDRIGWIQAQLTLEIHFRAKLLVYFLFFFKLSVDEFSIDDLFSIYYFETIFLFLFCFLFFDFDEQFFQIVVYLRSGEQLIFSTEATYNL